MREEPGTGSERYAALLETAQEAAVAAGDYLRAEWPRPRRLSQKGFRDLVTDADFGAQKVITELIRARFPGHGFFTEEADTELPADGPVIWLVDPLDGTSNYSRQQPLFSVSIAAAVAGGPADGASKLPFLQVVAGAVFDPLRQEMFAAGAGRGATLNGRPIEASGVTDVTEAIVSMDWCREPAMRLRSLAALARFGPAVHTIRSNGSAALGLAYVACGRFDAYLQLCLRAWDMAAGSLLVREAGGVMSDERGGPWSLAVGGCIAGNAAVHRWLVEQIGAVAT